MSRRSFTGIDSLSQEAPIGRAFERAPFAPGVTSTLSLETEAVAILQKARTALSATGAHIWRMQSPN